MEETHLGGMSVKWKNGTDRHNQHIESPTDEKRASQTLPPPGQPGVKKLLPYHVLMLKRKKRREKRGEKGKKGKNSELHLISIFCATEH
jgi:hypothetical protein